MAWDADANAADLSTHLEDQLVSFKSKAGIRAPRVVRLTHWRCRRYNQSSPSAQNARFERI